ncbi:leucyl/phenylalanyl-tRNA--protein transferase [Vibrio sp. WXL210]|uniref:leucyl/phenylalanyl-tRNA--protein transferase n=1 Tax=Vibrio sp. WXL210 TaxID=3450709 RepID=UPI003EC619A4
MSFYLTELAPDSHEFPSPFDALDDPNGLLAFGGDLSPQRLLRAYQSGIFPWYGPGEPLLWWSPAPRAVFAPKTFKPSKSVKKFQRKHGYQISINRATEQVISLCASTRSFDETWIHPEMQAAYKALASLGHCHSVEVWHQERLVGGLYGLSIGRLFCGESMFNLQTNASKIALWYFCQHFARYGGELIDCQVMNPHLESLGALELSREAFIAQLEKLQAETTDKQCFAAQWISLD